MNNAVIKSIRVTNGSVSVIDSIQRPFGNDQARAAIYYTWHMLTASRRCLSQKIFTFSRSPFRHNSHTQLI